MAAFVGFHCLAIVWIKLCLRCFFHIQTHICWRILSLSSRESGNQDRHYAYIKVFVPQILSQHNFTAQDAFRFPEEPINFILWMPVCSPFDLELTEHFAQDNFILNLQDLQSKRDLKSSWAGLDCLCCAALKRGSVIFSFSDLFYISFSAGKTV